MEQLTATLGLDIGGANLKAAHSRGGVIHQPFELWRRPDQLRSALASVMGRLPRADRVAVTMTGELCDCYETKRQGVLAILDAVAAAAWPVPVVFWTNEGRFTDLPEARAQPLRVAAANWLALAVFAGRWLPRGPGVVIDVGSTTTDLVPLQDGTPVPRGRTDPERLACQELIYTGVRRTPVCALLGSVGAAEWFATTLDVYLVLNMISEDPSDRATADGRPATRAAAHGRLARMSCADAETCQPEETNRLAGFIHERQMQLIRNGLQGATKGRLETGPAGVVLSGSGEFLARAALTWAPALPLRPIISLAQELGPEDSAAACAFAVAQLAAEKALTRMI
jgi:probable H4MPT-linked C1 transfer pathway protein